MACKLAPEMYGHMHKHTHLKWKPAAGKEAEFTTGIGSGKGSELTTGIGIGKGSELTTGIGSGKGSELTIGIGSGEANNCGGWQGLRVDNWHWQWL